MGSRTWKEQELLPKPKVPAVVVLLASCPICFSLLEVLLLLPVFREQPKSNFIYVSFFFSVPVCSCSCRRLDSTRLDSTRLGLRLRLRLRLRLDFYMYVDGRKTGRKLIPELKKRKWLCFVSVVNKNEII